MKKGNKGTIAVLVWGLSTGAAVAQAPVIGKNATQMTLQNGMEVLLLPDHRAPTITHMVWYRVGAADEQRGKSGIAHYLEHLMFKGTKQQPNGAFSKIIASFGGQENAFTSHDYTSYFQRISKAHLKTVMQLEADRMSNLQLDEKTALPERNVVLEERRMRTDNDPGAKLSEAFSATLYQNHPYGTPIIGWKHEIEQLTIEDARAFYDRYYTPNNATLVIAGDVTMEELKPLLEETYGKVTKRAEAPPRVRPQEPPATTSRRVILSDPRAHQPIMKRAWLTTSYSRSKDNEAEALDILAEIIGGGSSSRLYQSLVLDKKIAAQIQVAYSGTNYDDGQLIIIAVPKEGISQDALESEVDAVLNKIQTEGVTEEEVARAKKRVVESAIYAQDSQMAMARIFGVALMTGSTVESVQQWPSRIEAITKEKVNTMAKQTLNPTTAVTGWLVKGK